MKRVNELYCKVEEDSRVDRAIHTAAKAGDEVLFHTGFSGKFRPLSTKNQVYCPSLGVEVDLSSPMERYLQSFDSMLSSVESALTREETKTQDIGDPLEPSGRNHKLAEGYEKELLDWDYNAAAEEPQDF